MKATLSALAIAAGLLAGSAARAASMDVVDLLVDWKSLIGQTVTVTGCTLSFANSGGVWCRRDAKSLDEFFIDGETLAREDLRRAMRKCVGKADDGCAVDLAGVVATIWNGPELTNAAFTWKPAP